MKIRLRKEKSDVGTTFYSSKYLQKRLFSLVKYEQIIT